MSDAHELLAEGLGWAEGPAVGEVEPAVLSEDEVVRAVEALPVQLGRDDLGRSEEHTSELQSH